MPGQKVGQVQTGPRTHQCVRDLQLWGDLIEELGELLCQDIVLTGECSLLGAAQVRPGYTTHWYMGGSGLGAGWAELSKIIAPTGSHAKQAGIGDSTHSVAGTEGKLQHL